MFVVSHEGCFMVWFLIRVGVAVGLAVGLLSVAEAHRGHARPELNQAVQLICEATATAASTDMNPYQPHVAVGEVCRVDVNAVVQVPGLSATQQEHNLNNSFHVGTGRDNAFVHMNPQYAWTIEEPNDDGTCPVTVDAANSDTITVLPERRGLYATTPQSTATSFFAARDQHTTYTVQPEDAGRCIYAFVWFNNGSQVGSFSGRYHATPNRVDHPWHNITNAGFTAINPDVIVQASLATGAPTISVGGGELSGAPAEDVALTASTEDIDDPQGATMIAATLAWQWAQDGGGDGTFTDIDGATNAAFTPTQANVGNALRVCAAFDDDDGNAEQVCATTDAVANVNDAPEATAATVPIGVGLQFTFGPQHFAYTDADSDNLVSIAIASLPTAGTLQVGGADATPGQSVAAADIGTITFQSADGATAATPYATFTFTVTDDGDAPDGNTDTTSAAATITINLVANNAASGAPTTASQAAEDTALQADASGITDSDGIPAPGQPGAIAWQWQQDSGGSGAFADIAGATAATFTPGDDQVGNRLQVCASFTDNAGFAEGPLCSTPTAATTNINDAPSGAPLLSVNTPTEDSEMSANAAGVQDDDGRPDGDTWQWRLSRDNMGDGVFRLHDDSPLPNANLGITFSYTPTQADVGHHLQFCVSYTDKQGTAEGPVCIATPNAVANVNDRPVATNHSIDLPVNRVHTFGAADFPYTDDDGDGLFGVIVETAPTVGTMRLNRIAGGTITPTDPSFLGRFIVSRDELDQGRMTFAPADGATMQDNYASLTFNVQDDSPNPVNNDDTSNNTATLTINLVAAANNPPTGTISLAQGGAALAGAPAEDAALTASATGVTDPDGLPDPLAPTWQWRQDDGGNGAFVNISGATAATFTPGDGQVGHALQACAMYDDNAGFTNMLCGAATALVTNVNDAPQGTPALAQMNCADNEDITANDISGASQGQCVLVGLSTGGGTVADPEVKTRNGEAIEWWQSIQRSTAASGAQWTEVGGGFYRAMPVVGGFTDISSYKLGQDDVNAGWLRGCILYTDRHGTAEGGDAADADTRASTASLCSAAIEVANVNDAPVPQPGTISLVNDSTHTFAAADFDYTDRDSPRDNLASVQLPAAPSVGTLSLGGALVTAYPRTVAAADIATLVYAPAAGAPVGDGYATLLFGVTDDGTDPDADTNTASSGTATLTINLLANNPPRGDIAISSGGTALAAAPAEDTELSADASAITDADGLPSPFNPTWQWRQDNGGNGAFVNISEATAATFTPGDAQVGHALQACAMYTDNTGNAETVCAATLVVTNINDAPAGAPAASFDGGLTAPTEDSPITAARGTIADDDGLPDPFTAAWQWSRADTLGGDYQDIMNSDSSGATAAYTPPQALVGKFLRVCATFADGGGMAETLCLQMADAVANVNDAPVALARNIGLHTTDTHTFSVADFPYNDSDQPRDGLASITIVSLPASGSLQVDGADATAGQIVAAADIPTITWTPAADARPLDTASFMFRVTDNGDDPDAATNTLSNASTFSIVLTQRPNSPPTGLPTLAPLPATEDAALAASTAAIVDANGIPSSGAGAIALQWQQDGGGDGAFADIVGATATAFTPLQANVGNALRVCASWTDRDGHDEGPLCSAATAPVVNTNDAPTGDLMVSADGAAAALLSAAAPQEGTAYTAQQGTVADDDGIDAATVVWQWQSAADPGGGMAPLAADYADISGGDAATFTPAQSHVGLWLRVCMAYTDRGGAAERVCATAAHAVAGVNDAPTAGPTLGYAAPVTAATEDSPITADASSIRDPDGLGGAQFAWQWRQDDGGDGVFADITMLDSTDPMMMMRIPDPAAQRAIFIPGDEQVGNALQACATYTDAGGTEETICAATATVINVNDPPSGEVEVIRISDERTDFLQFAQRPITISVTSGGGSLMDDDGLVQSEDLDDPADFGPGVSWQISSGDANGPWAELSGLFGEGSIDTSSSQFGNAWVRYCLFYKDAQGTLEGLPAGSTATEIADITPAERLAGTLCAPAVQVENTDDRPVAVDSAISVTLGTAYAFQETDFRFTDVDGDSLSSVVIWRTVGEGTGTLALSGTEVMTNDIISVADIRSGNLTFTPVSLATVNSSYTTFEFRVTDDGNQLAPDGIERTTSQNTATMTIATTAAARNASGAPGICAAPAEDLACGATSGTLADAESVGTIVWQWHLGTADAADPTNAAAAAFAPVSGATAADFTPLAAHIGNFLRVCARFDDGAGNPEGPLCQTAAAAIIATNDAPTGRPHISVIRFDADSKQETVEARPRSLAQGQIVATAFFSTSGSTVEDEEGIDSGSMWRQSLQTATAASGAQWGEVYTAVANNRDTISYTITQADTGRFMRSCVFYTDEGGTAEGGDSATAEDRVAGTLCSAALAVANVNDAPVAGERTIEVSTAADAGAPHTFTLDDFPYTDADGDMLASVGFAAAPSAGTLHLGGVAPSYPATVIRAQIVGGDLTWFPEPGQTRTAAGYAQLRFTITDDGTDGTDNTRSAEAIITVNLQVPGQIPASGAPTVTAASGTAYDEDNPLGASTDGIVEPNGIDAATLRWQWQQAGASGGPWADITGADADTFTPLQIHVGMHIRVCASFRDQNTDPTSGASDPGDEGPLCSAPAQVANVNDAPTAADGLVEVLSTADAGNPYRFVAATFGFADEDPGDALASITVVTAPANGILREGNGAALGDGAVVQAANIPTLNFYPAAGAGPQSPYATFTFRLSDGAADSDPATITINLVRPGPIAASGAPTVVAATGTAYQEDNEMTASTAGIIDPNGIPAAVEWIWQAAAQGGDWVTIAGAVLATFTPGDAQVGRRIRACVFFDDEHSVPGREGGTAAAPTLCSAGGLVTNINDAPRGMPAIGQIAASGGSPAILDGALQAVTEGTAIAVALSTAGSTLADDDGLPDDLFFYSLQRGTADGGGGATVWAEVDWGNATEGTPRYEVTQADVEAGLMRACVFYTDYGGDGIEGQTGTLEGGAFSDEAERLAGTLCSAEYPVMNVNNPPEGRPAIYVGKVTAGTIGELVTEAVEGRGQNAEYVPGITSAGHLVDDDGLDGNTAIIHSWQNGNDTDGWAEISENTSLSVVLDDVHVRAGFLRLCAFYTDGQGTDEGGDARDATTRAATASLCSAPLPVRNVNDAPLALDGSVEVFTTATGQDPHRFVAGDFRHSDEDGDALVAVIIASLPDAGTLMVGDAAAMVGDSVAVAAIATLGYHPDAGQEAAAGYAAFTFNVTDDGDGPGGDAAANRNSTNAATITINLIPPGQLPATGAPTITGTAEQNATLTAARGTVRDPNGINEATIAWQWQAASTTDGGYTPIDGASEAAFVPTQAQVGLFLQACMLFDDNFVNRDTDTPTPQPGRERRCSPATAAVLNVNDAPMAADAEYRATRTGGSDTVAIPASVFMEAYSDIDGEADALAAVAISTLPDAAHGVLSIGINPVARGQRLAINEAGDGFAAGDLTFAIAGREVQGTSLGFILHDSNNGQSSAATLRLTFGKDIQEEQVKQVGAVLSVAAVTNATNAIGGAISGAVGGDIGGAGGTIPTGPGFDISMGGTSLVGMGRSLYRNLGVAVAATGMDNTDLPQTIATEDQRAWYLGTADNWEYIAAGNASDNSAASILNRLNAIARGDIALNYRLTDTGTMRFWARYQSLDINGNEDEPLKYDGSGSGFYLGADNQITDTMRVGIAISTDNSDISVDLDEDGQNDDATRSATSFYPYLHIDLGGNNQARVIAGFGSGTLDIRSTANTANASADLSWNMLAASISHHKALNDGIFADWLGDLADNLRARFDGSLQLGNSSTAETTFTNGSTLMAGKSSASELSINAELRYQSNNITPFASIATRKLMGDLSQAMALDMAFGADLQTDPANLRFAITRQINATTHQRHSISIDASTTPNALGITASLGSSYDSITGRPQWQSTIGWQRKRFQTSLQVGPGAYRLQARLRW